MLGKKLSGLRGHNDLDNYNLEELMAKNKYYYWLRLMQNFYERKQIKMLRKANQGDKNIIIYQELLLLAINTEGIIKAECEDYSLYDEIAIAINEDMADVSNTIELLIKYKLANLEDNSLFLKDAVELVGQERHDAEYQHQYYESRKAEKRKDLNSSSKRLNSNTNNLNSSTFSTEKETDLDKEKEKKKTKTTTGDVEVDSSFKWWNEQQLSITGGNKNRIRKLVELVGGFERFKELVQYGVDNGARNFKYLETVAVNPEWNAQTPPTDAALKSKSGNMKIRIAYWGYSDLWCNYVKALKGGYLQELITAYKKNGSGKTADFLNNVYVNAAYLDNGQAQAKEQADFIYKCKECGVWNNNTDDDVIVAVGEVFQKEDVPVKPSYDGWGRKRE